MARASVRGRPCALRFFPPCRDETVVPCHLPSKALNGTGLKTPDLFAVPGCSRCHDIIDRRGSEWREVPPELREERMRLALMEWLGTLLREGVMDAPVAKTRKPSRRPSVRRKLPGGKDSPLKKPVRGPAVRRTDA